MVRFVDSSGKMARLNSKSMVEDCKRWRFGYKGNLDFTQKNEYGQEEL